MEKSSVVLKVKLFLSFFFLLAEERTNIVKIRNPNLALCPPPAKARLTSMYGKAVRFGQNWPLVCLGAHGHDLDNLGLRAHLDHLRLDLELLDRRVFARWF